MQARCSNKESLRSGAIGDIVMPLVVHVGGSNAKTMAPQISPPQLHVPSDVKTSPVARAPLQLAGDAELADAAWMQSGCRADAERI